MINIRTVKSPISNEEIAKTLLVLFSNESLWEKRANRNSGSYRSAEWYTVGAAVYLDHAMPDEELSLKTNYFNDVILELFPEYIDKILHTLSDSINLSCKLLKTAFPIGVPGFHIFKPHASFSKMFGRFHEDLQWKELSFCGGFPFQREDMSKPFSFTHVLQLPFLGGGLLTGDGFFEYKEGDMYIHSGEFKHAIAPFPNPVLPIDWRITLQGHGFVVGDMAYVYW